MALSLKERSNFQARNSEFYADVFLHIPSANSITTLKLHKVVLAAASPMLDKLFRARENMKDVDLCLLPKTSPEIIEIGVNIIYGQSVSLSEHLESRVIAFLRMLEVQTIKTSTENQQTDEGPASKKKKHCFGTAGAPSPPSGSPATTLPAPTASVPVRTIISSTTSASVVSAPAATMSPVAPPPNPPPSATLAVPRSSATLRTPAPAAPSRFTAAQTSSRAQAPPRPPAQSSAPSQASGPVTTAAPCPPQAVITLPAPPASKSPERGSGWSDLSSVSPKSVKSEDLDNFDLKGNFELITGFGCSQMFLNVLISFWCSSLVFGFTGYF